jgi:hypothetical protein
MRELRTWAYPGQPRQHWHYWSITRALKRRALADVDRDLGLARIGVFLSLKGLNVPRTRLSVGWKFHNESRRKARMGG